MTEIRTPDQRVRVFVSSTMRELAAERAAAKAAIEQLRLTPILFELGARPYPPRELYLAYLRQSDVFVGIYGARYGWIAPGQEVSGLEDEYLAAADKPKLIYIQASAANRDSRLEDMIGRIQEGGLSYRIFNGPAELATLLADDLALLLSERFGGRDEKPQAGTSKQVLLPHPASRFIGRREEIATLRSMLLDNDARLITLVGPGGIGKTRLALEVTALVQSQFDVVALVELEQVTAIELVAPSLATSLGLPEGSGTTPIETVTAYLQSRKGLLLIDNFEHLIGAAPLLAQLLTGTTDLKLLVTSRERLSIAGEHVFDVPPLPVAAADQPSVRTLESDAVALFVERTRAAGGYVSEAETWVHTVADICRRLDGLPFAIELAAARAATLGAAEVLRRLDHRLSVLTSGAREVSPRKQTLRSTIAWSYDLLGPVDRQTFQRLSVFAGSFALEAAEAICADASVPDVLDGIVSLTDKSLLRPDDPWQDEPRFTLLQVVREFASEQLVASGEADRLKEAHANFYEGLALNAHMTLRRGHSPAVERYIVDYPNLHAAMLWLLANGAAERAARMGVALWPLWWVRSRFAEGVEIMQRILAQPPVLTERGEADADVVLGILRFGQGQYSDAIPALHRAMDLYSRNRDRQGVATAAVPYGVINAVRGDPEAVQPLLQAVDHFRSAQDEWGLTFALFSLGGAFMLLGRVPEAIAPLEESVELGRSVGADVLLSNALVNLGRAQLLEGNLRSARDALTESIHHAAARGHHETLARSLEALGALAEACGKPSSGARLLGSAESMRRVTGASVWGTDRTSHEETEARLRKRLGKARYMALRSHGETLSMNQLLSLVQGI